MPTDKYPLLCGGTAAGELAVTRDALYTVFEAVCPGRDGLWSVWAVGQDSTLRIGVPEPVGNCLQIRRRFSQQLTGPLGPILRGELRPLSDEREQWSPLKSSLLPAPLRQKLQGLRGVLSCQQGGLCLVAIPRNDDAPFPLETMFCFAQPRQVKGRDCWVFAFDRRGCPRLP